MIAAVLIGVALLVAIGAAVTMNSVGHSAGYYEGFDDGKREGYADGSEEGYAAGLRDGGCA